MLGCLGVEVKLLEKTILIILSSIKVMIKQMTYHVPHRIPLKTKFVSEIEEDILDFLFGKGNLLVNTRAGGLDRRYWADVGSGCQ